MACYILWIELEHSLDIRVGALGLYQFPAGHYYYVGRAKKNLAARLARHGRKEKKLHWHIDYLLQHGIIIETFTYPGNDECGLARSLAALPDISIPVLGFGSSDCSCKSHLFCYL